jgi:hypothetical protein
MLIANTSARYQGFPDAIEENPYEKSPLNNIFSMVTIKPE